jgi:hypothetical protein
MLVMPLDDELIGPSIPHCRQAAKQLGEDWRKNDAVLSELIEETSNLLTTVDAAISQTELVGDQQWEAMRRSWCFLGPHLLRELEDLKRRVSSGGLHQNWVYPKLAFFQIILIMRCRTLHLNDIEV